MSKKVSVSLNFMPSFYHKHIGNTYGEAYYFEPNYRARIETNEAKFLYDILGQYNVGNSYPSPSTSLFIQPVDLIMATQGAELRFPEDGTLETWGTPWEGMSVAEISSISEQDAAHHPIIDRILAQYQELTQLYGEKADLLGLKSGIMNIHTPYTTAHQLYGEELFILIAMDPAGAVQVLDKVAAIYGSVFERLTTHLGVKPKHIQLGDCAASMLSNDMYETTILPCNQKISRGFKSVGYHSCGPSTHLLKSFSGLANLSGIQLGPGTDLKQADQLFGSIHLQPLIDPLVMLNRDQTNVSRLTKRILDDTKNSKNITLCAWSFDRDTKIENVEALYQTIT